MSASPSSSPLDVIAAVSINGVGHPATGHAFQLVLPFEIRRVVGLARSHCIVCSGSLSLHLAETVAGVCHCINCGLFAHRKCACSSSAPRCAATVKTLHDGARAEGEGDGLTHLLRARFTELFQRDRLLGGNRPAAPPSPTALPQATMTIWEEAALDVVSHSKPGVWELPKDGRVETFCQNLLSDENTDPGRSVVRLVALFMSQSEAADVQLKSARMCLDALICVLLSSLPSGVLDELQDDVLGAICELSDLHCLTHSQGVMQRKCSELSKIVAMGSAFDEDKVTAALLDARENPTPSFDFWFCKAHLLNVQSTPSAQGKLRALVLVQQTLADEDTPSDALLTKLKLLLILSSGGPVQPVANFIAALHDFSAECIFMRALKSEESSAIGIEAFALESFEAAISLFSSDIK